MTDSYRELVEHIARSLAGRCTELGKCATSGRPTRRCSSLGCTRRPRQGDWLEGHHGARDPRGAFRSIDEAATACRSEHRRRLAVHGCRARSRGDCCSGPTARVAGGSAGTRWSQPRDHRAREPGARLVLSSPPRGSAREVSVCERSRWKRKRGFLCWARSVRDRKQRGCAVPSFRSRVMTCRRLTMARCITSIWSGGACSDPRGATIGTVRAVVSYPSVDALVVDTPSGEIEIPMVEGIVLSLESHGDTVVVDPDTLRD